MKKKHDSDYFCKDCKEEWEDAMRMKCKSCGSTERTTDYDFEIGPSVIPFRKHKEASK